MMVLGGCSHNAPAAPDDSTPPVVTTPPPVDPPSLTCPGSIRSQARSGGGLAVSYAAPSQSGGQGEVQVRCAPESGAVFPVGTTTVDCQATDTLNRTGSCSFSVTVDAPPRLRVTRIMAFGDSITEGQVVVPGTEFLDLVTRTEIAYPTVLSQLLSARYTDQRITVTNRGRGGERAAAALSRFVTMFGADAPEAVVLMEGYNDLYSAESGAQGIQAAEDGVSAMAADARNRGARVFICTLAPSKPGRRRIPLSSIMAANDRLRVVARGEGAYLIDVFNALLPDVNANVDLDGLHLTPAGYQRVAEAVFAAIKADLEIK
jgi:lysophospholipase L1-like esterase